MKDLIVIGSHCPDFERQEILNKCIDYLQPVRNDFDILISSHVLIPDFISNKVDYIFYDKNNELLYDSKYQNKPYFTPGGTNLYIQSIYVNEFNTYLAVYRLLISGFGFAKVMGYSKAHYIEYDVHLKNTNELYENSKLLDNYGVVLYKGQLNKNLYMSQFSHGFFQSVDIENLDDTFLYYNKEKLLSLLENSGNKINEKVTQDIHEKNKKGLLYKDVNIFIEQGCDLFLSETTLKEKRLTWAVPFYHIKKESIDFIVVNTFSKKPISVKVIVNSKIYNVDNLKENAWFVWSLGSSLLDYEIIIYYDDKIKNVININDDNREEFKKFSYATTSNK
jgi:hypothetical protein